MNFSGKKFVERLRVLVRRDNTKVTAVTDYAGVSNSTFSVWETRDSLPRVDVAYKIAQFFNVTVEYLLTGEDSRADPLPPERISDIVKMLEYITDEDLETVRAVCGQLSEKNAAATAVKVG